MECEKYKTHSIPLHKRVCFFRGHKKSTKKAETPRGIPAKHEILNCSTIVSQITNQYPQKPEAARTESKDDIEKDTSRSALTTSISTHAMTPFHS